MINNRKVLAIIPARKGSKRLPNKNILPLDGKPLISWTIEASIRSNYIDDTIVSTDSDEIIAVAQSYGVMTPFIRPEHLSTDTATTSDVILHALEYVINNNSVYDIVIILQPTSPLRDSVDIDKALEMLVDLKGDGVISVCSCEHNPLWSNILPDDGNLNDFIKSEIKGKRGQDLPHYYRFNGAIYTYLISKFIDNKGVFYSKKTYAYIMEQCNSVDIDTQLDFVIANALLSEKNNNISE